MTPERMREIRESVCLTVRGLARLTDRAEGNLRGMEAGQRSIPENLAEWMEKLGKWIERNPPPEKMR